MALAHTLIALAHFNRTEKMHRLLYELRIRFSFKQRRQKIEQNIFIIKENCNYLSEYRMSTSNLCKVHNELS